MCWLILFTELLNTSDSGFQHFQQPGSVRWLSDIPLFLIQGYNVKVIKRITMLYYDVMTPIRHPLLFPYQDDERRKTDNPGRANRKIIKWQLGWLAFLFTLVKTEQLKFFIFLRLIIVRDVGWLWL